MMRAEIEEFDSPGADLIIPISRNLQLNDGLWFEIENSTDVQSKDFKIPPNVYKAVLEVYVSFHENDELPCGTLINDQGNVMPSISNLTLGLDEKRVKASKYGSSVSSVNNLQTAQGYMLVKGHGCSSYCNLGLSWKSSSWFVQLGFLSNGSKGVSSLSAKPTKLNANQVFRACSSSSSDPLLVKAARRERGEPSACMDDASSGKPWEAFHPDGVIIFSDILTPLPAIGVQFDIEDMRGPVIQSPIRSEEGLKSLHPIDLEKLQFVGDSLRILRKEDMCHTAPHVLRALLSHLSKAIAEYIVYQVESGAHCIQIFDSWGGQLPPHMWDRCHQNLILTRLDGEVNRSTLLELPLSNVETSRSLSCSVMVSRYVLVDKKVQTPLVLYINGNGGLLERMKTTGVDVIGLDWTVDMADGRKRLGTDIGIQGNVDPATLFCPLSAVTDEIKRVVNSAGTRGHILNLGHGARGTPEEAAVTSFDVAKSFTLIMLRIIYLRQIKL
ncbi:hypothetical protein HAX54_046990 [Datura stramonium]|uniref:Uroporphyrinogen decarboxylase n=1 Tax=Datura stramonium TaxID=4076 RepID=A0ABS8RQ23_DATST|nr:hypothetical protein [Datura stramonium]